MKPREVSKLLCVICGSDKNVEQNHAGCRNHLEWFTLPFCERHHRQFHRLLESVGLDLRYTSNRLKRLVFAGIALTIALWMVLEGLREAVSLLPDKKT